MHGRSGVGAQVYDKHICSLSVTVSQSAQFTPRANLCFISLWRPHSSDGRSAAASVTKPINFSYNHWPSYNVLQASERKSTISSEVSKLARSLHSTYRQRRLTRLLPISSSSSSPLAHWILITPKSGGFTFRCNKKPL